MPETAMDRSIRVGTQTPKGYRRDSFQEAWNRYLDGENPFEKTPIDVKRPFSESTACSGSWSGFDCPEGQSKQVVVGSAH